MLNIVKFPNPILREKLVDFNFSNPSIDPKQIEKDMLDLMYTTNGVGLAANQVGQRFRMFVMGHKDSPDLGQAFFNPEVVASTTELRDMVEGCLSFPEVYVKIKRPTEIKARWQNSAGEWQESEFSGYDCKCFLHELDHLEGITFQDRVSTLKWALAVKQSKKRKS